MDQLDGPAWWTSLMDQLDGSARQTSSFYLKPWSVRLFKDFPFSLYIVPASESDEGLVFNGIFSETQLWMVPQGKRLRESWWKYPKTRVRPNPIAHFGPNGSIFGFYKQGGSAPSLLVRYSSWKRWWTFSWGFWPLNLKTTVLRPYFQPFYQGSVH